MRARWNTAMLATVALLHCWACKSATITATAGDNQSASVLTAFPIALSATVTESNVSVQNAIVTFTAPASGASGTFAGGLSVVTVLTDASGIATAPDFTSGSIAGSYQVLATVDNASGPANFNLTNEPGPVDHFVFEMPGGGAFATTEVLPNSFTIQFQFTAKDAYNNTVTSFNGSVPWNYGVAFRSGGGGGGGSGLAVFINGVSLISIPPSDIGDAGSFGAGVDAPAVGGGFFTICHPGDGFAGPQHAPTSSGSEFTAIGLGQQVIYQFVPPFRAYAGTIHFTSSDPNAVLPPDYTFSGDGAHTFTATFFTHGIQTIGCYDIAAVSIHEDQQNGSLPAWWDVKGPFNNLSAPTITTGTPTTTLGGTILYGASIPTGAVSISVGTSTVPATIDQATGNFSALVDTSALTPAGSPYTITYSYPGDANNAAASATAYLYVIKHTPTVTWTTPADISYGVALSGTQLNATANTPGTFIYTPPAGNILNAGANQTLSVLFTPNDTANFTTATATVTINVAKATPVITWANPSDIVFGVALGSSQLDATADTAGAFTYAPSSGSVLNAGANQTLSALFVPINSANFTTATATVSINVTKVTPTITWNIPADIVFGAALDATQLNATSNVPGTFVYTPAAGTVLNAGARQLLSVTFLPTDAVNYATTTASVLLNVLDAAAPVLLSSPTAMPNPATVGAPVALAVSANDLNGGVLDYAWNFGDGFSGKGSTTSHVFTSPGTYAVSVTITNSLGAAVVGNLDVHIDPATIFIAGGGALPDSNGDGIPDEMASAALNVGVTLASAPTALSQLKLSIRLDFAHANRDSLVLSGDIPNLSASVAMPKTVIVDVGGVVKAFTLNATGKATTENDKIAVAINARTSKTAVAMQFTRGSFAAPLSAAGLINADVKNKLVAIPVVIIIDNQTFAVMQGQTYTAKKGKTGQTKNTR